MNTKSSLDIVVNIEWNMMKEVNNISGPASCQMNEEKFKIMRRSQFEVWSNKTIESYKRDLILAIEENRNLIEEKYAYMMENTYPEYYKSIEHMLPKISENKIEIITSITNMVIDDEVKFKREYPLLSRRGRKIFSKEDTKNLVSIETYNICELKTYSINTLLMLNNDYNVVRNLNKSIAKENLMNIINKLGYSSLEEAEISLKNKI